MTIVKGLNSKGGVDNRNYKEYADILKFSDSEEKWTRVGEMAQPRSAGAVSIVDFDEFKDSCLKE